MNVFNLQTEHAVNKKKRNTMFIFECIHVQSVFNKQSVVSFALNTSREKWHHDVF